MYSKQQSAEMLWGMLVKQGSLSVFSVCQQLETMGAIKFWAHPKDPLSRIPNQTKKPLNISIEGLSGIISGKM